MINSQSIDQAFNEGISLYFTGCRARVDPFCKAHFSLRGTWRTNRNAWGWDLLRAPANLLWAPCYVVLMLFAWCLARCRLHGLAQFVASAPSGFKTSVQKYLAVLLAQELLCLTRSDDMDSLEAYIIRRLDKLVNDNANSFQHEHASPPVDYAAVNNALQPIVHQALKEYTITRTASADITNSLTSTLVGAFAFKKFTPGGFAIGIYIAAHLAQYFAIDDFFLGNFLGGIYYGLFPAVPSAMLSTTSIVGALMALAVFASFSGLLTDPIQYWLGLHQLRLRKMVNHIEKDLVSERSGGFKPKDQFVARILELLDAAKAPLT